MNSEAFTNIRSGAAEQLCLLVFVRNVLRFFFLNATSGPDTREPAHNVRIEIYPDVRQSCLACEVYTAWMKD